MRRRGTVILDGIDWSVQAGQRWVVLGPNGSGKTSMLQLASADVQPTEGTVEVLGHELGRVDVRRLRTRIALVERALLKALAPGMRRWRRSQRQGRGIGAVVAHLRRR